MPKDRQIIPSYQKVYQDLKGRIRYQRSYTYLSCLFFLFMQYSVPVVSGLFTALFGSGMMEAPQGLVVIMGIVVTGLGALNSVVKPAESYDWAVLYSNKFEEFENDFNLGLAELNAQEETDIQDFINYLKAKNHELAALIDQSNARRVAILRTGEEREQIDENNPAVREQLPATEEESTS